MPSTWPSLSKRADPTRSAHTERSRLFWGQGFHEKADLYPAEATQPAAPVAFTVTHTLKHETVSAICLCTSFTHRKCPQGHTEVGGGRQTQGEKTATDIRNCWVWIFFFWWDKEWSYKSKIKNNTIHVNLYWFSLNYVDFTPFSIYINI